MEPIPLTDVKVLQLSTKTHSIEKEIKYLTKRSYNIRNTSKLDMGSKTKGKKRINNDIPFPCPPGYNVPIVIEVNGTRESTSKPLREFTFEV